MTNEEQTEALRDSLRGALNFSSQGPTETIDTLIAGTTLPPLAGCGECGECLGGAMAAVPSPEDLELIAQAGLRYPESFCVAGCDCNLCRAVTGSAPTSCRNLACHGAVRAAGAAVVGIEFDAGVPVPGCACDVCCLASGAKCRHPIPTEAEIRQLANSGLTLQALLRDGCDCNVCRVVSALLGMAGPAPLPTDHRNKWSHGPFLAPGAPEPEPNSGPFSSMSLSGTVPLADGPDLRVRCAKCRRQVDHVEHVEFNKYRIRCHGEELTTRVTPPAQTISHIENLPLVFDPSQPHLLPPIETPSTD